MSRQRPLWAELLLQAVAIGGLVYSMKMCVQYLDPYREQREQAKKRALFLRKKLGKVLELNEFEQLLAAHVVNPAHIEVEVTDVLGLDAIIQELEYKVLYPLQRPEVYSTTLWKQTTGVLFYGPPGTGKTMLAKALAKQSGCYFLNISTSSILSKWLGDASRLVRAVFTLAQKLQPCIIFIDEVDALLGKRGSGQEHEAMLQVKTEFMQLWDGMESSRGQRVVVMGATNRPWMVDEAVLRRFSTQYEIGLPDADQRRAILHGYLTKHHQETGGVSKELLSKEGEALSWVASRTAGFSGSDLMELCSQAAQRVLVDLWDDERRQEDAAAASIAGQGGLPPSRSSTFRTGAAATTSPATSRSRGGASGTSGSGAAGAAKAGAGSSSGGYVVAIEAEEEEDGGELKPRALRRDDFEEALKFVGPSSQQAEEYKQGIGRGAAKANGGGSRQPGDSDAGDLLSSLLLNILASQAGTTPKRAPPS